MSPASPVSPFHLAFAVRDLEQARAFYVDVLGCGVGREADTWIDFDFWGHQVVAHLDPSQDDGGDRLTSHVDGKNVPAPHFGVVMEWGAWHQLRDKLDAAGLEFIVGPYIRFEGQPGEQATLFVRDPSGNALEFKSFKDLDQLFARD